VTAGPRKKGTGGHGRRRLEGKGPTPPAHMRPGHPANKRAAGGGAPARGSRYGDGTQVPGTGRRVAGKASRPAAPGKGAPGKGAPGRGAKGRGADGPEIVAGRNAVLESLRAAIPANTLYIAGRLEPDDRVAEAIKLADAAAVPVLEAGRGELDRLTGGALHQGVALRVPQYEYAHPADLAARAAARGAAPLIVALDGVTDPRNLGAVVRSAAAFGADGVVIPARRSAGVTAAAWKASAGALAHVPVARATNLVRALEEYMAAGLFVAGLDAAGGTDVGGLDVAGDPLVIVVGSEGRGLSRLTAQRCDLLVRIPIVARTESLNASVAAAIALYEIARTRAAARQRAPS
jgi:23S rRNA (guanosine2251-2'-O)-methyltransferase